MAEVDALSKCSNSKEKGADQSDRKATALRSVPAKLAASEKKAAATATPSATATKTQAKMLHLLHL